MCFFFNFRFQGRCFVWSQTPVGCTRRQKCFGAFKWGDRLAIHSTETICWLLWYPLYRQDTALQLYSVAVWRSLKKGRVRRREYIPNRKSLTREFLFWNDVFLVFLLFYFQRHLAEVKDALLTIYCEPCVFCQTIL